MTTKTILLVEDNHQDEMLTLRALKKINLANRIDVVRDGQQAIDYLFREGEFGACEGLDLPTVVLLDINLPRISGLEVLERLRADSRTHLLPIVLLTSSDEERDRLRGYHNARTGSAGTAISEREGMSPAAAVRGGGTRKNFRRLSDSLN